MKNVKGDSLLSKSLKEQKKNRDNRQKKLLYTVAFFMRKMYNILDFYMYSML